MVYMDHIIIFCNKSTLHILEWIDTYEVCKSKMDRENIVERRGLAKTVQQAYSTKEELGRYIKMSLCRETLGHMVKKSTKFLHTWLRWYQSMWQ